MSGCDQMAAQIIFKNNMKTMTLLLCTCMHLYSVEALEEDDPDRPHVNLTTQLILYIGTIICVHLLPLMIFLEDLYRAQNTREADTYNNIIILNNT